MRCHTMQDLRIVSRAPTWMMVLSIGVSVGCGILDVDENDPGTVSIEGTVISTIGTTPIAGAVIGTSIDGQTATTDGTGSFRLETVATGDWCCTPYTITVSATGFETFSQSDVWGQHPVGHEYFLVPIS